ncbi:restriction endonuclease [Solibacillus daqui]|uniref:restriction endonuclease n=1 Tax=Solibacillus daqui TaxID=2912187 RepID=UPI00236648C1|nr:restriction endonuclease [Solibacillus daqui]
MSIWLFRAGSAGEFEDKFLKDERVYLTWNDLNVDLREFQAQSDLRDFLIDHYELAKPKTAVNWASQIFPIIAKMQKGDWVILPSKRSRTIHFGEIIGDYTFDETLGSPYYHYRKVKWFATDIPRDNFEQDLLYSFGAFMTVCKIHKNDAEVRLKAMANNGWKHSNQPQPVIINDEEDVIENIEEHMLDQISDYITKKFKGHRMERLIEEILKAKGYTTYRSPEGADGGIDILAASGELGFGGTKICVQVKSHDAPVDRPAMDQLIGTMSNVGADYGLLVSWRGFKTTVTKEIPKQFFKLRLWDANDVIKEIFNHYDQLSIEIRSEIPLKQIWVLNFEE